MAKRQGEMEHVVFSARENFPPGKSEPETKLVPNASAREFTGLPTTQTSYILPM